MCLYCTSTTFPAPLHLPYTFHLTVIPTLRYIIAPASPASGNRVRPNSPASQPRHSRVHRPPPSSHSSTNYSIQQSPYSAERHPIRSETITRRLSAMPVRVPQKISLVPKKHHGWFFVIWLCGFLLPPLGEFRESDSGLDDGRKRLACGRRMLQEEED
jgi:hypothetical protein